MKTGLILGARSYLGVPYDGHTLKDQLEQTNTILEPLGVVPTTSIVDLGYRGRKIEAELPDMQIIHRGKYKSLKNTNATG